MKTRSNSFDHLIYQTSIKKDWGSDRRIHSFTLCCSKTDCGWVFKPLLSETDEVNRCERFPLTPCARTFQNKENIHYNTMNCRAKVCGPDSGSVWYF